MSDTTTPAPVEPLPKPQPPAPVQPIPEPQRDADKLGEPGLKALQAERERADQLERDLGPLKKQMDALRDIFGGDGKDKNQDIAGELQKQFAALQKDNLVDRVARRHGITEDNDVDFLRHASDEAAMTRLAQRLTATVAPAVVTPNAPAPDPSQGAQPPTPEAMTEAEYAAFYPSS